MKFNKFVKNTKRTWNVLPSKEDNLMHCYLGLTNEAGELCYQYKAELAYYRKLEKYNIEEEIGDIYYFCARLLDEINLDNSKEIYSSIDEIFVTSQEKEIEDDRKLQINLVFEISDLCSNIHKINIENKIDLVQEIKRIVKRLARLAHTHSINNFEILDLNIEKLKIRFPEKFDAASARNPDHDAEREVFGK